MKFNRILLISMVIISLLAIGAVSASENVSDVIKTSDVNDVVTVENDVATFDNLSKEIENEQIDLSENEPTEVSESESALLSQSNPVVVNVADDGINKDDSLSDGFTLIFPIQSLQHANKSDILSRGSIFQEEDAISNNHPSGIRPSKTGNIISLSYCLFVKGMVGLTGLAS